MKNIRKKYKNIDGKTLNLHVVKNSSCTCITIKHNHNFQRSAILLLILVVFNLVCLVQNLLTISIISFIFILSIFYLFLLLRTITKENIVMANNLGYQISKYYLIGSKTTFLPFDQVQKIFVNEVIYHQKVLFILTLMISNASKTDSKLMPLFFDSKPRLDVIEQIYKYMIK